MKRFKNILCVINPEKVSAAALERAVTLTENNQADLTVVCVIERFSPVSWISEGISTDELQKALLDERSQGLNSLIGPYRGRVAVRTDVLAGTPFMEIIREVLRGGHDLVIKAAEQPDWLGRLFDSDDMHLLRKCPCPVWLIKPDGPGNYRCILAAVDVDDAHPPAELETRDALNRRTMELALSVALSEFAELHVMQVWYAVGESAMRGTFMRRLDEDIAAYAEQVRQHYEARLNALMREMSNQLGSDAVNYVKPHVHLVKGFARREIPAFARQIAADLIVMGTVARSGIPGFMLGNTAEAVLSQIDCSVIAIKPPDFVTPVALEA